ncbi:autotransporter outer membrane beta-barrel domain-containing protein [Moraxella bovoculi]|uniref:autotransporter outer membrane beta-barrel domain-containing protein n=1 Tax=Moraxella bovoculi TaxID=386891 RepID=UPI003F508654
MSESVYGIGNSTKTDSIGLTVGASKKLDDAYVLGWVKGAKVDTEASRGENSNKVEYNGKLYGAGIQAGTNIDTASGVSVQPYAFVNHQQYKNDGSFNDGLNIVNDIKAKQTQVGVGADMLYQATPALQLTGGVQLAHAVSRDTELSAQYVGTSTDLSYDTWSNDKTKWLAKVGASYSVTPNSQVGLNYSYTGSGDSDASQVGLSFTSKF